MFRKEGALIMSITANGVIYFKSSIEEKYLNDFSFSIMEEAIKRRIGLLLGANLSPWDTEFYKDEFKINGVANGKGLLFSLSESAFYSNCDKLFEPIYINNTNHSNNSVNISKTQIAKIEEFFGEILKEEFVTYLCFNVGYIIDYYKKRAVHTCVYSGVGKIIQEEIAKFGEWKRFLQINIYKN